MGTEDTRRDIFDFLTISEPGDQRLLANKPFYASAHDMDELLMDEGAPAGADDDDVDVAVMELDLDDNPFPRPDPLAHAAPRPVAPTPAASAPENGST
mmetsp:Transcript_18673/g.62612  ORF Transcript_18673/g.62612 Transcript_18673/m.62612 type:complete len:98 (-) Transcript_18673:134-427(-)